jgi:hypothetical protein
MEEPTRISGPCGVAEALAAAQEQDCHAFQGVLHTAAATARDKGDEDCAHRLQLLANAASLHLQVHDTRSPYVPMMVLGDRRTTAIEDFSVDDLAILRSSVDFLTYPALRARVGDILWETSRDQEMARVAVAAYLELAITLEDPERWPPCLDALIRASQLARQLGRNEAHSLGVLEAVASMLERHPGDDPSYMSAKLIELLLQLDHGDLPEMADVAGRAAQIATEENDWHRRQTYLELRSACLKKAGDDVTAMAEAANAAESMVHAAESAAQNESHLVAAAHLEEAIAALRRIPGSRTRVDELHARLLEYQRNSVGELREMSVPIDTRELTASAVQSVAGKEWPDALQSLLSAAYPQDVGDLRDWAAQSVRDHPLQYLFSSMRLNAQGKVVSRRPGLDLTSVEGSEPAVLSAMAQRTTLHHSLFGQAVINPARLKIVEEHQLTDSAIGEFLKGSAFVPEDRLHLFNLGVLRGFQGDFITSLHVLVPQIESSLRVILAGNGVIVSGLDAQGIQREHDLNTLLFGQDVVDLLGPDLTYDLQQLLVAADGSNLRNQLAHGLLPTGAFYSPVAVYAWWSILHLIEGFKS